MLPQESQLRELLREQIPSVLLHWQSIPHTGLEGFLLERDSASLPLDPSLIESVMEEPPFWGLLWPAGYLLCRLVARNRQLVVGRHCVDLGCGSGLLAAALGKAEARVTATDSDPLSLLVTALHLSRHQIEGGIENRWDGVCDTLFLADVLYDENNLKLLDELESRAAEVVVADCRLERLSRDGFELLQERRNEEAFPDLDPHREFGRVRIWYKGDRASHWRAALEAEKSILSG